MERREFLKTLMASAVAASVPVAIADSNKPQSLSEFKLEPWPKEWGEWTASASYHSGDVIYQDGYFYACLDNSIEVTTHNLSVEFD